MEQLSFLNNLLGQIQTKAAIVAINISSRSVMEIIELDKNGLINNYDIMPIEYNNFTKEFENIYELQSNLKQKFAEMKLSLASKVYISIPTYVIEHENLPMVDDDESIKTMLISSAEKNYIFKKYDPAISYFKMSNQNDTAINNLAICYTALRADEYTKIKNIFEEIGLKVLAIDSSYSSLINGVIATNKITPSLIGSNGSWNIINITSNSYMIMSMQGKILNAFYEEPLAVKSFTEEEIYQVIANSLDINLSNFPASQTVIVSQSDNVSAEYLANNININGTISYIEDNKYRTPLVPMSLNITQSLQNKISLEAIGITTWNVNEDGFKFNFLDAPIASEASVESITINIDGKDVELTSEKLQQIIIVVVLVIAVVLLSAYFLLSSQYKGTNDNKLAVIEKTNTLKAELNVETQSTGISESEFLQKNYTKNVNYKKSYASVAREIPDMLWVEELQLTDDSKLFLKGRSYRMEDILNYYDSLNKLGKFSNLKISTLKVSNTPISDLLLQPDSDMREETTYEFAFGEQVYVDSATVAAQAEKKENNNSDTPAPPAPTEADVPPAPTSLPKQDN